jgi:hypothetical protein
VVVGRAAAGDRLLEIGIGNGSLTDALRRRRLNVVTADFDQALRPDVVADVRALPFEDDSFAGVLAFEVLEHLPWDDLPKALSELRRVAPWSVVSVPNVGPALSIRAELPNALHIARMAARRRLPVRDAIWGLMQREAWRRAGGTVSRVGAVSPLLNAPHIFDGQHYWVLGEGGLESADFSGRATECGLAVTSAFRPAAHPSHHFFILERT